MNYYAKSQNINVFPVSKRKACPNARYITEGNLANLLSSFAGKDSFTVSAVKKGNGDIETEFVIYGRLVRMLIPKDMFNEDTVNKDTEKFNSGDSVYAHISILHLTGSPTPNDGTEYDNIMYGGVFDVIDGDDKDQKYNGVVLSTSADSPFGDNDGKHTHIYHLLFNIDTNGNISIPSDSLPVFMHVNGGTL